MRFNIVFYIAILLLYATLTSASFIVTEPAAHAEYSVGDSVPLRVQIDGLAANSSNQAYTVFLLKVLKDQAVFVSSMEFTARELVGGSFLSLANQTGILRGGDILELLFVGPVSAIDDQPLSNTTYRRVFFSLKQNTNASSAEPEANISPNDQINDDFLPNATLADRNEHHHVYKLRVLSHSVGSNRLDNGTTLQQADNTNNQGDNVTLITPLTEINNKTVYISTVLLPSQQPYLFCGALNKTFAHVDAFNGPNITKAMYAANVTDPVWIASWNNDTYSGVPLKLYGSRAGNVVVVPFDESRNRNLKCLCSSEQ